MAAAGAPRVHLARSPPNLARGCASSSPSRRHRAIIASFVSSTSFTIKPPDPSHTSSSTISSPPSSTPPLSTSRSAPAPGLPHPASAAPSRRPAAQHATSTPSSPSSEPLSSARSSASEGSGSLPHLDFLTAAQSTHYPSNPPMPAPTCLLVQRLSVYTQNVVTLTMHAVCLMDLLSRMLCCGPRSYPRTSRMGIRSMFRRMVVGRLAVPEPVTVVSLVAAIGEMGALREGKCCHGFMVRMGFDSDLSLGDSILNLYAKMGAVECALKLFEGMGYRDVITWSCMVACYARNGNALGVYKRMVVVGEEPCLRCVRRSLGALFGGVGQHRYI